MPEKTEAPTGKRISEARNRGQVLRSAEVNAALGLFVAIWLLKNPGSNLVQGLKEMVSQTVNNLPTGEISIAWVRHFFYLEFSKVIIPLAEIILALLVLGIIVTLIQTRGNVAHERKFFDWSRFSLINGLKRIFSGSGVIETLKALLKLVIVGFPVYSFLTENLLTIVSLGQMDLQSGVTVFINLCLDLMSRVAWLYLLLAAADYIYQRKKYFDNLKMAKEEVKEEYKQSEGDPTVKGRIRSQQMRMARIRMMAKVPTADVIVTNPTHLAIAIKYDNSTMQAPVVVAKGAHLIAEKIVQIAKDNSIPVVQNIPLARAIYRNIDIDQEISSDLYFAMAEILAYVYRIKNKNTNLQPSTAKVS